eukprot:COSAG06_NODE_3393_length_5408_cov_164.221699_5_plen_57_part_00
MHRKLEQSEFSFVVHRWAGQFGWELPEGDVFAEYMALTTSRPAWRTIYEKKSKPKL